MRKNFVIKSYNQNGAFLGCITDTDIKGFTTTLTDGLGECVIVVGKKFDDVSSLISEGNHVEIWVSDKDTVAVEPARAIRIYQGEITVVNPSVDGSMENVEVHLSGYGIRLGLDVLKSGAQTKLYTRSTGGVGTTATAQNVDIGTVVRGILDRYIAETTNPRIAYSTTTIPTVGTNMTYVFTQRTYREAIEKCLSVAPFGYYSYLGADGMLNFKAAASTPTHKFVFGKHFASLKVARSIERVRNFILIYNGTSYKKYEDGASIQSFGRRAERLNDTGIADTGTMDLIGAKFLAENKSAEVQFVCTILDNAGETNKGYDIESIKPGDTCSFYNFSSAFASLIRENMIITQVDYQPNQATITVEPIKYGISDVSERLKKQISETQSDGMPASYT